MTAELPGWAAIYPCVLFKLQCGAEPVAQRARRELAAHIGRDVGIIADASTGFQLRH
jgi:hypothetical protein